MEKTISIRNTEITFSIWDLGGQREFVNMLPLVCNDAVAILFMFDLTRKSTLNSIKEWYRQGRGFNKTAIPFLVGTKYDHFVNFPKEDQEEISTQVPSIPPFEQHASDPVARRFAKAMRASLIFSSTSHSINVQKVDYVQQHPLTLSCPLTVCRSSRLFSRKLSTSSAPYPKSRTLASPCCCINRLCDSVASCVQQYCRIFSLWKSMSYELTHPFLLLRLAWLWHMFNFFAISSRRSWLSEVLGKFGAIGWPCKNMKS